MIKNELVVRNIPNVLAVACELLNMCKIHGKLLMSHRIPQKMMIPLSLSLGMQPSALLLQMDLLSQKP